MPPSRALQITRRQVDSSTARFTTELHPCLQKIYLSRGVCDDQALDLNLQSLLAASSLKGLSSALQLLLAAVTQQQRILIVGDFDADGATSTALAVSALQAMGAASVDFLVPNRFEFGYGLTPEIVAVAASKNPDLIITVDNGISSIDGVDAANALGIAVLVTDHHLPGAQLPAAAAIVNPNQPGCSFSSKNLAGVGVIFYLLSALKTALQQQGWFQQQTIAAPNMADYLDLVALGTVADVVPLDHNNRILVEQGLRRIRAGKSRPGIEALLTVAGRNPQRLVSSDLGFAIGPRLNAAGRLDDISLGIQCLLAGDEFSARDMAMAMDDLNRDRKQIEGQMQQEALASLQQLDLDNRTLPYGLCLFDKDWHQGVVGILASRIKERFHRPVIAFAQAGDGSEIKGSARSIKGLHIRDALDAIATANPGLLSKFGGHAMAAGMSMPADNYPQFAEAFDAEVRKQLSADDLEARLISDGELDASSMTMELAQLLRMAGPWGQLFPEPCFDGEFLLLQQRLVGKTHLKMVVALPDHPQQAIDAIAFNIDPELWPNQSVERVHLAYKLDVNEFRGRESLQLMVDNIEVCA